jgi:hypothetical protein
MTRIVHYGCCVDIFHWTLLFGLICAIVEYRSDNDPPPVGAAIFECIFLGEDKCGESLETQVGRVAVGKVGLGSKYRWRSIRFRNGVDPGFRTSISGSSYPRLPLARSRIKIFTSLGTTRHRHSDGRWQHGHRFRRPTLPSAGGRSKRAARQPRRNVPASFHGLSVADPH